MTNVLHFGCIIQKLHYMDKAEYAKPSHILNAYSDQVMCGPQKFLFSLDCNISISHYILDIFRLIIHSICYNFTKTFKFRAFPKGMTSIMMTINILLFFWKSAFIIQAFFYCLHTYRCTLFATKRDLKLIPCTICELEVL